MLNEQQEKIEHLEECNHRLGQDIIQSLGKRLELMKKNEQLEKGKMEALSLLGEEIDKNEQLKNKLNKDL